MNLTQFLRTWPFVSNTLAGSGNQSWFAPADPQAVNTGRIYYRIFAGGEYPYSLLFSDQIDSTYSDGSHSRANLLLGGWRIHRARVGVCAHCAMAEAGEPDVFTPLTFQGAEGKQVSPGEWFVTDEVRLAARAGDYLCVELSFSGERLPFHPETLLPAFRQTEGKWVPSQEIPFPGMIGCKRPVKARLGYLGDSITQGCGTEKNTYTHWNAFLSEKLGADYSFWNLGLGFGRAADAASGGSWLAKAKALDGVVVCYGVNDILKNYTREEVCRNLRTIVTGLREDGVKVLLQTVPPFDYTGEKIAIWQDINAYIRRELFPLADGCFDDAVLLGKSPEEPHLAPWGGHPNAQGCALWADALYALMTELAGKITGGK